MLKSFTHALARNLPKVEQESLIKTLSPETLGAVNLAKERISELVSKLEKVESEKHHLVSLQEKEREQKKIETEKLKEQLERSKERIVELSNTMKSKEKQSTHPIFGKLLYDFGYKKVYASEPKRLTDKAVLPVWEKQRIFRPERAKTIAKAKQNDMRFGFPGVITIYDLDAPDKRGIVDGQHRIGGLEILLQHDDWKNEDRILTEVYHVGDTDASKISDLFLEINLAESAREIDLPGAADEKVKEIIDNVSEKLRETYKDMFKDSARCRPPHLNIDNFRQELFSSQEVHRVIKEAIEKDAGKASEFVLDWIEKANEKLASRSEDEWKKSGLVRVKNQQTLQKALEKCKKFKFYLGIDHSWH